MKTDWEIVADINQPLKSETDIISADKMHRARLAVCGADSVHNAEEAREMLEALGLIEARDELALE